MGEMMLFLIRLEHANMYITTHIIHAKDLQDAKSIFERFISKEYAGKDGNWFVGQDGDAIKVETFAEISDIQDLTKWIPDINEFLK